MADINVNIEALEAKGFKRWQKAGYDRMYINATTLGLDLDYYKSGNVCYAEWKGEKISNSWGRSLKVAKTYLDLKTGKVHSTESILKEAAEELIASVA